MYTRSKKYRAGGVRWLRQWEVELVISPKAWYACLPDKCKWGNVDSRRYIPSSWMQGYQGGIESRGIFQYPSSEEYPSHEACTDSFINRLYRATRVTAWAELWFTRVGSVPVAGEHVKMGSRDMSCLRRKDNNMRATTLDPPQVSLVTIIYRPTVLSLLWVMTRARKPLQHPGASMVLIA